MATFGLEELSNAFNGGKVYVEVKVKSYDKPNTEMLKLLMRNHHSFELDKNLFIASMSTNESSNDEDTRYSTELRFTQGI